MLFFFFSFVGGQTQFGVCWRRLVLLCPLAVLPFQQYPAGGITESKFPPFLPPRVFISHAFNGLNFLKDNISQSRRFLTEILPDGLLWRQNDFLKLLLAQTVRCWATQPGLNSPGLSHSRKQLRFLLISSYLVSSGLGGVAFELVGDNRHLQKERKRTLVEMGRTRLYIRAIITSTYIAIYLTYSSEDKTDHNSALRADKGTVLLRISADKLT